MKSFLVALSIFAAVSADVSHLLGGQNGYNYDIPAPSFNPVIPQNDYLPPSLPAPLPSYSAPAPVALSSSSSHVEYAPTQVVHHETVEHVQQPQVIAPQPQFIAPQPQFVAQQQQFIAPQPQIISAPAPLALQQDYLPPRAAPILPAPIAQPVYHAPAPVYHAPAPVYHAPAPVYQQSLPVAQTVYQAPAAQSIAAPLPLAPAPVPSIASLPLATSNEIIPSHSFSEESGYSYNVPSRR